MTGQGPDRREEKPSDLSCIKGCRGGSCVQRFWDQKWSVWGQLWGAAVTKEISGVQGLPGLGQKGE